MPWHLSRLLGSPNAEFNWRFGRLGSLDYAVGPTDSLVKSEVFDLRGLSGASMTFNYFQNLSVVNYGDYFQVLAIPVDEFNKETPSIFLKEYNANTGNNSTKFEMTEQFLDLTQIAGKKFRLVFRVVNPSGGISGGIGWIFGNIKIYTDERVYLY
jgi:hypothetical protein